MILEKQKPASARKKTSTDRPKIEALNTQQPVRQSSAVRIKPVEPFEPIEIPLRERKPVDSNINQTLPSKPTTK
jgi:hypothetical protein